MSKNHNITIVGAGLSGIVAARLLADKGYKVTVFEQTLKAGGLCSDGYNKDGIFVSDFGPHLFHTSNENIWNFVNSIDDWVPYTHIVKAYANGQLCDFPVNYNTIKQLNIADLPAQDTKIDYTNAETYLYTTVGPTLTDLFYRSYNQKHWHKKLNELDHSIVARVHIRYSTDNRYSLDRFQAIPKYGYTHFVEMLLKHKNISVCYGEKYINQNQDSKLIFTGRIDEYYDYCFGELDYAKVKFQTETYNQKYFQDYAQINYPSSDVEYTRIVEYKHITQQDDPFTTISKEIPNSSDGIVCYPKFSYQIFNKYKDIDKNVLFLGRLAEYKYINMDQAILNVFNKIDALEEKL